MIFTCPSCGNSKDFPDQLVAAVASAMTPHQMRLVTCAHADGHEYICGRVEGTGTPPLISLLPHAMRYVIGTHPALREETE
jgi:hypothetical protein